MSTGEMAGDYSCCCLLPPFGYGSTKVAAHGPDAIELWGWCCSTPIGPFCLGSEYRTRIPGTNNFRHFKDPNNILSFSPTGARIGPAMLSKRKAAPYKFKREGLDAGNRGPVVLRVRRAVVRGVRRVLPRRGGARRRRARLQRLAVLEWPAAPVHRTAHPRIKPRTAHEYFRQDERPQQHARVQRERRLVRRRRSRRTTASASNRERRARIGKS